MAITNAQQARQLYNNGGPMRKIKGQDHMLAYITPGERDTLVDLGGQETMTPEGILAYPPEGNYGSEAKGPGSGPGPSGITGMASTGGANFSSGNNVGNDPSTGEKGTGQVSNPTTYIDGQKYDVTTDNFYEREEAEAKAREKKQKEKKEFITTDNTPDYLPGYVKFLAGLNNTPNRKFFYDKVIAAGKIPGLNYGEEELEQAYQDYMDNRMAGKTDAYGNPTQGFNYGTDELGKISKLEGNFIDNGGGDNNYIPPVIPGDDTTEEEDATPTRNLGGLAPRFAGSIFDFTGLANGGRAGAMDGGRMMNDDDPVGGIMDLETSRQMYGLGKLVKKITRGVKKVAKSPVGKAALMYFGGKALMGAGGGKGLSSFFGKGSFSPFKAMLDAGTADAGFGPSAFGRLLGKTFVNQTSGALTGLGKTAAIGIPSILAGLMTPKEEEDNNDDYYKTNSLNIADIRNNPYNYLSARNQGSIFAADGGIMRNGYAEGSEEPVAKKTMPLLDMDGQEMDLRDEGGFVPLGRMERADDVPARLSKNEFVFTADAVRNAGEGDVDKGAEVMYNMMKNLESGGEVSEESQGLDGAKEMFKTSQRLEEVI
jgi:hypothetical protein